MKRKIKLTKKMNKKTLVSYLLALVLGISNTPALAATTKTTYKTNCLTQEESNAIISIYQIQMNYLSKTINNLKDFYTNVDTEDIIKNAYPNAYNVINYNFNNSTISYGSNYKTYIPNNLNSLDDYYTLVAINNELISNLKIKPLGNGREPEYGIIPDKDSQYGFRKKTDKDYALIDKYTNILGNIPIFSNNVIEVLKTDTSVLSDENLLSALETIINSQINYIINSQRKIKTFYETIDTENIIKEAYPITYANHTRDILSNCYYNGTDYSVVRDFTKTTKELLTDYIETIKHYNQIIYTFKIKAEGTGRDPEYGIISDKNSQYGFRIKTDKDYALIDEYTNIIGNLSIVPEELINYLEVLANAKEKEVVKSYENKRF